MKRSFILLGLLVGVVAHAQTEKEYYGKVGINTQKPKATLEINPNSANSQETATTNEGLLIPRLSKARIANMESPAESTMVYVTDIAYTGVDKRVAGIAESGFYYFDGTRWIKQFSKWGNDTVNNVVNLTNLSDGTTTRTDDKNIYIKDDGNIGVGTNRSEILSAKLDVNGNVRVRQMVDATALESTYTKAVVADASGNLAVVSRTNETLPNSTQTIFGNNKVRTNIMKGDTFYSIQMDKTNKGESFYRYTGQSISLPPGKWIVYSAFTMRTPIFSSYLDASGNIITPNVWVRGVISENNTDELNPKSVVVNNSPLLISANLNTGALFTVANGIWLVDNTTLLDKTYYVKISLTPNFFSVDQSGTMNDLSIYSEDYLFAIRRL